MKVHVVTGGGSGMGFEIAKRLKDGLVIITGRTEDKLKRAVGELRDLGINADYKTSDITVEEDVKDLFEFAKGKGEIKSVVNSAGVSGAQAPADLTFKIDLMGTKIVTDAAYEYLSEGGVLLLIASMNGHAVPANENYDKYLRNINQDSIEALTKMVDGDGNAAYSMSKRGVLLTVEQEADRFGDKGLRIVSISPGIIETPMAVEAAKKYGEVMNFIKKLTPLKRNGKPEDVANAAEFLLSDKASFISGIDLLVDGGVHLHLDELAKLK